ncbi:hypothetical protein [Chrysiogenes arsenatis]|uniref:hypothetical protein n=1 Tax=Chrysiogenes arsenatis TaxID=309797 RepID=UPI0004187098|nr:hypothetical protein [Chrysiogenes arsenatis]
MDPSVDMSRYASTVEYILLGYLVIALICALLMLVYALKKKQVSSGMACVFAITSGAFWPMTLFLVIRKYFFGKDIPQQPVYRKPWERFGK